MKLKGIFYRSLAATLIFGTLIVASVALVLPTQAEEKELGPPKLVWERTFEKEVIAAGIDRHGITRGDKGIGAYLKWVMLRDRVLWLPGESGEFAARPEIGDVSPLCVSGNGRYLFSEPLETGQQNEHTGLRFALLGWDGKKAWDMNENLGFPLLWDDGSSVFLQTIPENSVVLALKFRDAQGAMTSTHLFPKPRNYRGDTFMSISKKFFAIGVTGPPPEEAHEIYVFRKDGQLLWKREDLERWYVDLRIGKTRSRLGGVTVSDRGDVLAVFFGNRPYGPEVLVYDQTGTVRDSVSLSPSGTPVLMETQGDLAFLSTGACFVEGRVGWSRFLCYDLRNMRTKFLLCEQDDHYFESFDVDPETGRIAVMVHDRNRGSVVKIYDSTGTLKNSMSVETGSRVWRSWLRLARGTVLVAEKTRLRLYAIDGR